MNHGRKICVIGLGYVGLPVALCFAKVTHVIAFDTNLQRIKQLKQGIDSNNEHRAEVFRDIDISYTHDPNEITAADFYIVAVPTPIDELKQPDLSMLRSASEMLAQVINKGDIIVYESTVYPGATEEYCAPILEERSGLRSGKDFFLGYSPERINPGDHTHTFPAIKKIVSAQTQAICDLIAQVYGTVVHAGIHQAPSIKVAEAAKIIENTQRDINVALMNEFSLICQKMDIDTLDVLAAATTKWNFLPFKPGLVGGHCIGIDPYYLTYKASSLGHQPKIILAGRQINDDMYRSITKRIIDQLNSKGQGIQGSTISILGITFKENIADLRNSKVLDIINQLFTLGATLQLHDPIADGANIKALCHGLEITDLADLRPADAMIIAVSHQRYQQLKWSDLTPLLNQSGIVFDVKGILPRENIPPHLTLLRL